MNYAIHTITSKLSNISLNIQRRKEWSPVLYWSCFGFRLLSALGTPGVETWGQEWKQYFPWNIVMKMNERSVRRRKHEECPSFSVAVKSAAEKGFSFGDPCQSCKGNLQSCQYHAIWHHSILPSGRGKEVTTMFQLQGYMPIYFGPRTEREVWPE